MPRPKEKVVPEVEPVLEVGPDIDKLPVKQPKTHAVIRCAAKTAKGDNSLVPVRVNGKKWTLNRSEIYPVPMQVVTALRNAIKPVYPDAAVEDTMAIRRRKEVDWSPRYPFELLQRITKDQFLKLWEIKKKLVERGQDLTQVNIDEL
jgi:hypothetical protein